jgi:hypothetical protein
VNSRARMVLSACFRCCPETCVSDVTSGGVTDRTHPCALPVYRFPLFPPARNDMSHVHDLAKLSRGVPGSSPTTPISFG